MCAQQIKCESDRIESVKLSERVRSLFYRRVCASV